MGGELFRWKCPSTKIPFFPLHLRKKADFSFIISTWARLIKLELPKWISTSPCVEEFRPITVFWFLTRNSNSFPRIFANTSGGRGAPPPGVEESSLQAPPLLVVPLPFNGDELEELSSPFLRANNAQASAESPWSTSDMFVIYLFVECLCCITSLDEHCVQCCVYTGKEERLSRGLDRKGTLWGCSKVTQA